MAIINLQSRREEVLNLIEESRMTPQEQRAHNMRCIPAVALFFDASGKQVWDTKKDMRYHLTNGTKAIKKGAVRGVLVNLAGDVLEELEYQV